MTVYHPFETLRQVITDTITAAFPTVTPAVLKFEVPPDPALGHLSLSCFKCAAVLKQNPAAISESFSGLNFGNSFSQVTAKGAYLNFFINAGLLSKQLFSALENDGQYGSTNILAGKTVMVEFSSPNTNKPLHLGHCRNNTLGMVLANLLEKCGSRVVRANLINDRGIHICKSMLAYRLFGAGKTPESTGKKGDHFVGEFYVAYAKAENERPELDGQVREMLRDWENGKADVVADWKTMNAWVLDGFNATYERTGIRFDRLYYESELYQGGKSEVTAAVEKGICKVEEDGAVSIDLSDVKLGKKILLRKDGTAIYMTQDIFTTISKFCDYPLDACLFVVGNEQEFHFRVLFATLKKFGYTWADSCEHISYGMITLPEGRMKSREGTVVDLDNLLDEVHREARLELIKREAGAAEKRSAEELDYIAEQVAQAAVKYTMLRYTASRDFMFDPGESLAFEGATGPYLLYTYARICSVLQKSSTDQAAGTSDYSPDADETLIVVALLKFPDIIISATLERNPAVLALYSYDLAKQFNKFYAATPILKSDAAARRYRLDLCLAVQSVLGEALKIMSINTVSKM